MSFLIVSTKFVSKTAGVVMITIIRKDRNKQRNLRKGDFKQ